MGHDEGKETKERAERERRREIAFTADILRFIPNGFKIRFVLRSIAASNQLKNSVHEER